MKKNDLYLGLSVIGCLVIFSGFMSRKFEDTGAPSKYTGSPFDGRDCTKCHKGTSAQSMSDLISSDIPAEGYTPGETYSFMAKIAKTGHKTFGFQASPQDRSGKVLGTLVNLSSATKITGSDKKYITHTKSSIKGTDEKSWSFDWTAPAKGTGVVTFYSAFIAANSDGDDRGDLTFLSKLEIPERITDGVEESEANLFNLKVFPNPAIKNISISYTLDKNENISIYLYDLKGRKIENLLSETRNAGKYADVFPVDKDWNSGVYFLRFEREESYEIKKIIIGE